MTKRLYILGTRGIPAAHGGFETFAEYLSQYLVRKSWDVTVYCQKSDNDNAVTDDMWHGVRRVHLSPVLLGQYFHGPLGTGVFDLRALLDAKKRDNGVFLTLGYNTGIWNLLPRLWGKTQAINMDGIEWQRAKWSWPYKLAFRINYKLAGLAANLLIADHPEIQLMLQKHFKRKPIAMIPYGANFVTEADPLVLQHYRLAPQQYLVVIARPEPENNILEIVRAWSKKRRGLKLVILGYYDLNHPYQRAVRSVASDEVVFAGAIYKSDIVRSLRFHALAYVHGHSVGGTNPSLVEALGAGNTVIAHDNVFNRVTAGNAAIYFRDQAQLEYLLDHVFLNREQFRILGQNARIKHQRDYQWPVILGRYEEVLERLLPRDS